MTYKCEVCGKVHDEWPSLAFNSPDNYLDYLNIENGVTVELSSDFCTIVHPDQTDRFIRAVLNQKVKGSCQNLSYGIWVSLSEKNFLAYQQGFGNNETDESYFGWLCNVIPGYEFTESVPTTVRTQGGGSRPLVFPHDDFDHLLVRDFYDGIEEAEALSRISDMLRGVHSK